MGGARRVVSLPSRRGARGGGPGGRGAAEWVGPRRRLARPGRAPREAALDPASPPASRPRPEVRLAPGKADEVRGGRPWVYRGEIAEVRGDPATGDLVTVRDARGAFLATAFYHSHNVLAARVLTRRADEEVDDAFFRRRLEAACALRSRLAPDADAYRLVFAEADGLPGLVVDRYGPVLVVQTLAAGMDARLAGIADALTDITGVGLLWERNVGPLRRREGLPQRLGPLRGDPPEFVEVHEGVVRLGVALRDAQKTGMFLDQRENHVEFGSLVRRLLVPEGGDTRRPLRVLDAFCYTGGFGLQALAAGATHAVFLDSDPGAVEGALANARRNGLGPAEGVTTNAFDQLRLWERSGRRFEAIACDPPGFARSRGALDGAYRGYKELNLRSMRLLSSGGVLCTCSCSRPVDEEMFEGMLRDAAADVGRRMRVLARRGAPPDHPGLLGAPHTRYLKCFLLQALD